MLFELLCAELVYQVSKYLNYDDFQDFVQTCRKVYRVFRVLSYESNDWIDVSNILRGSRVTFKRVRGISGMRDLRRVPNATHVELTEWFTGDLSAVGNRFKSVVIKNYDNYGNPLPDDLEELEIAGAPLLPIYNLPASLKSLTLSDNFNVPIVWSIDMPYLRSVHFSSIFDHPIDTIPDNVHHLSLGMWFNQHINHLPEQLKTLYIGDGFDSRFLGPLPSGLKLLVIGANYNNPLPAIPNGIKKIRLGRNFDQDLSNLPLSLEFLELKCLSNVQTVILPENLISLQISKIYAARNSAFEMPFLPKRLKALHVPKYINKRSEYQKELELEGIPDDCDVYIWDTDDESPTFILSKNASYSYSFTPQPRTKLTCLNVLFNDIAPVFDDDCFESAYYADDEDDYEDDYEDDVIVII